MNIVTEIPPFALPIRSVVEHCKACASEVTDIINMWTTLLRTHRPEEFGQVMCPTCTERACCNQVVLTTLPEAIILALHFSKNQTIPIAKALSAHGVEQDKFCGSYLEDKSRFLEQVGKWADKQIPCPLLIDGCCAVGDLAPATCRTYFVMEGSDCGKDDIVKQIDNELIVSIVFDAYQKCTETIFGQRVVMPPRPMGVMVAAAASMLADGIAEEK